MRDEVHHVIDENDEHREFSDETHNGRQRSLEVSGPNEHDEHHEFSAKTHGGEQWPKGGEKRERRESLGEGEIKR